MQIKYTQSKDPLALGKAPHHLTKWQHAASTIEELVAWAYVEGRAFAAGVFDLDADLLPTEHTHKVARLWQGSQLIVIDIDEGTTTLQDIRNDETVKKHAACVMPSSSHGHAQTKAHIVFVLDRFITDARTYKQLGLALAEQLSFPVDTSTLTPSQAIYGTVYTHDSLKNHVRSLDDGLVWINDAVQLVQTEDLTAAQALSNDLAKRTKAHANATPEAQTDVVLEALDHALGAGWGEQPRERRLQTIMSAFVGSNHSSVLDKFLSYSSPRWDVSNQKMKLADWWQHHQPRPDGLTVASLFAEARAAGWLQNSTSELQGATPIHVKEVADWLLNVTLPPRVLLKSGTGTGKTQAAIRLLQRMQLEADVKAVFFAPSIKLCHALSASLNHAGVTNTLYIEEGQRTKDKDTLQRASVLVTTLQTFAIKAFDTKTIYDLVVIDECDELLSAFVRSGINRRLTNASHVDSQQARRGVEALRHLFETSKQVLLLDGTMTELSRYLMHQWTTKTVGVYENTYTRSKAPVTLYGTLQALRGDFVASVAAGRRVVAACDTKAEAALLEMLLLLSEAATKDEVLRVTSETAADPRVTEFFRDVEAGAARYRVVIYNSAMGSGVSIVNTVPDDLYLFATYLTPRKLLQILNRYRQQKDVYAFVQQRETLYSQSVRQRYDAMQLTAQTEEIMLKLKRVQREGVAQVVSDAALIVANDEWSQSRATRDFFISLLRGDGREVRQHYTDEAQYTEEITEAREVLKALRDDVKAGWRSVEPIRRGDSFPQGLTDDEVARGLLHGYITDLFPSLDGTGLDDATIADLALRFGPRRGIIRNWLQPERVINNTVTELQSKRRESVTYRLYLARVELLTLVQVLFPDIDSHYDDMMLEEQASRFLHEIMLRKVAYDLIASRGKDLDTVLHSNNSTVQKAIIIARVILRSVGLTLKRGQGRRKQNEQRDRRTSLSNLNELVQFVRLSGWNDAALSQWNRPAFIQALQEAQLVTPQYEALTSTQKQEVIETLETVDNVLFVDAVNLYKTLDYGAY